MKPGTILRNGATALAYDFDVVLAKTASDVDEYATWLVDRNGVTASGRYFSADEHGSNAEALLAAAEDFASRAAIERGRDQTRAQPNHYYGRH